jgi:secondary thiamine-phosphate synthase enzyme
LASFSPIKLDFNDRRLRKSYRKELWFNVPRRRQIVRITEDVQTAIDESGIKEGLVLVNAMNITASVFINDDESGLHSDYEKWLEKLAPEKPYSQYAHNGFEDNADAHLKRTIMGREVVCAITNGQLDFGTWEQIFYYELDGKRQKHALIKIIGE